MRKIYNFNNGVAYPRRNEYCVRSRQSRSMLKFIAESDKYVLKKICQKSIYRYPYVQFEANSYELISIDDEIKNAKNYLPHKQRIIL